MQLIADFVNSSVVNLGIDGSEIENVQTRVNEKLIVDGWISLVLINRECIVLKFNNGVFMNEGYMLNDEKVLKVFGNDKIGVISYNKESIVEGIVDLDSGTRFEGRLLKKGKIGIPFGFGEMYDDNGKLIYKGIMINWKRFGYGVSYHDNGEKEYEGYWCDNNRFGKGKVYDRKSRIINNCMWYEGNESIRYQGNGSNMHIGVKTIVLNDHLDWKKWDLSYFVELESIEIGNNSFSSIESFKIDGLHQLKKLIINKESFTLVKVSDWDVVLNGFLEKANNSNRSFHVVNCKSLQSIEIGEHSFSDFAGKFELRNLPSLESIKLGQIGTESWNFYYCSFELKGYLNLYICD